MIAHVLALCAAMALPPRAAPSCSCDLPADDIEALARARAAFVGRQVGERTVVRRDGVRRRIYTFAVVRWEKGGRRGTVEVETGMGGGDCGVIFQRGRVVTVYGRFVTAGRMATSFCSYPFNPFPPPVERPRPERG